MRRARHQGTTTHRAKSTRPASVVMAEPEAFAGNSDSTVVPPVEEVLLCPAGTFTNGVSIKSDLRAERRRDLAIAIRQRIETRLHGRVRNLVVRILGSTVVLEGQCSTYYTKQLAQHTALGVLENEQLENALEVCVPR